LPISALRLYCSPHARPEPIHPGAVLRERFLEPLGLTSSRVARAIGVESGLVGYLGTINRDLKRRIRSRKAKSQW
jgi:plasmid maintenance system antidote protein VapI